MAPPESAKLLLPQSVVAREAAILAPWAMHSADTAGRVHAEPSHAYRGPFQRDRDRIVHSAAYRRLSAKTQVFTGALGDYHRTRLTHTLEVASIARTLARALALNEDLVEALALVHDLGHPPFGHAGEDVLEECLSGQGGFSHNRQAMRIVQELEVRYQSFPGLNLSLEVLDGQSFRSEKQGSALRPLLEVQAVEAADSIAYDTHDADDALELGLIELDDLLQLDTWAEAERRVRRRYAAIEGLQLRRSILHELIDWQVGDLVSLAAARLESGEFASTRAVREASLIISASAELAEQKKSLESYLREHVYRHPQVLAHRSEVQNLISQMFAAFSANPQLMPQRFEQRAQADSPARAAADYIAGMTDRFAMRETERLRSAGVLG